MYDCYKIYQNFKCPNNLYIVTKFIFAIIYYNWNNFKIIKIRKILEEKKNEENKEEEKNLTFKPRINEISNLLTVFFYYFIFK